MAQHDLGSGSPEILDQPLQVTSTKDRTLFSVLINIWGLSCKMCGQSQTGKEYHRHEPGTPPPAHVQRAAVTTLSPQGSHRQPEVNYSSQSTSLGLSFCKEGQLEAFETSQIMMHLVASGAACGIINPS